MSTDEARKLSFSLLSLVCIIFLFSLFYYFYPLWILLNLNTPILATTYNYIEKLDIFPLFYELNILLSAFLICFALLYYPKRSLTATYVTAAVYFLTGVILLFCGIYTHSKHTLGTAFFSIITYSTGLLFVLNGAMTYRKVIPNLKSLIDDPHNNESETFLQINEKIENKHSVNIPTKYQFDGKIYEGWLNLINLFRGLMVIGTPGSGKSFAIIEEIMFQLMSKFFTMVIYDFKFATLTKIAYNYLKILEDKYKDEPEKLRRLPKFYILNFDDIALTNRANPIDPYLMTKQSDATNAATTIMLNLNKDWIKSKNFFAKSAISYVSGLTWYLKLMSEKYGKNICTLPHVIMLSTVNLDVLLDILMDSMEVRQLLIPFKEALEREAQEQLAGQTASAQISLSQIATKEIFYVMSASDFTLDVNNPSRPKIVCIGNNPNRKEIYAAPIGLYFSKILQVINQSNKLPVGVVIDELPTIFINGLDEYISTARSNFGATILGIQSISQMIKDYGKDVSDVIYDICANIISGSAKGVTADYVSKIFGKNKQQRHSHNISKNDTTTNLSMQLGDLLPISKLASLSQGTFTGVIADTFSQKIEQKLFHSEIIADMDLKKKQDSKDLPIITDFRYEGFQKNVDDKIKELSIIGFYKSLLKLDFECNNYIEFYNTYLKKIAQTLYKDDHDKTKIFISNASWLKLFESLNAIESLIFKATDKETGHLDQNKAINSLKKYIYDLIELTYIEEEKNRVLHDNYIKIIKDVDELVKEEYYRIKGEYPEFSIFDEKKLTDDLKTVISEITPEEQIMNAFNSKVKKTSKIADKLKQKREAKETSENINEMLPEESMANLKNYTFVEDPIALNDPEFFDDDEFIAEL